jgi:hypothetical protein
MSGVEAVGLALGVFSLITQVLDHAVQQYHICNFDPLKPILSSDFELPGLSMNTQ